VANDYQVTTEGTLMFRSILVPLDGHPQAASAMPLARSVAEATGAAVYLLRVTSPLSKDGATAARKYLEPIADELRGANLRVETMVRHGDPATEIVAEARACDSDLVVMATRAPSAHSITVLTSVARHVLANSPAPVLLVRPGDICARQFRTLLVPVDGSPGGSLALAAATALARPTGARIVLLDVVVPIEAHELAALPGMTLGGFIDPAWEELAQATARTYVQSLACLLRDARFSVEAHVTTGQVASEIMRYANDFDADLVVMSTHATAWPGQAYLSSVAGGVVREGHRPVLLVRREVLAAELADADSAALTHAAAGIGAAK
jgi:nucleotide-binding universal stress UspA family protein